MRAKPRKRGGAETASTIEGDRTSTSFSSPPRLRFLFSIAAFIDGPIPGRLALFIQPRGMLVRSQETLHEERTLRNIPGRFVCSPRLGDIDVAGRGTVGHVQRTARGRRDRDEG